MFILFQVFCRWRIPGQTQMVHNCECKNGYFITKREK